MVALRRKTKLASPVIWSAPSAAVRVGSTLTLIVASAAIGVGMSFPLVAVAIGATLLLVLGVAYPKFGDALVIAVLLVLPFVVVYPALQPLEHNYLAYAAIGISTLTVLRAAGAGSIRVDLMSVALAFLVFNAASAALQRGLEAGYTIVVIPALMLGVFYYTRFIMGADRRRWLITGLIALLAVEGTIGFAQTLLDLPGLSVFGGVVYAFPRNYFAYFIPGVPLGVRQATGTFEHFNSLGSLLALLLPISYGYWRENRKSPIRAGVLVVGACGLVATFSRGALAACLLAILLGYWKTGSVRSKSVRRLLAVLAVVLAASFGSSAVIEYMSWTGNLAIRMRTWSEALQVASHDRARLVFGFGLGYFRDGILSSSNVATRIHSVPLQLVLETGVIGFGLLSSAFIRSLCRAWNDPRGGVIWMMCGVLAFLVHQTVDNALFTYVGVIFVAVVAVMDCPATT